MRKWLVGLLALACIGATSWAETATYTVASKTEVTLSGTAPDGATAVYEQTANNMGQATANNTLKLTLKGYEGTTITGLKLSMKSNASKGAGSLSVTCGDAIIAGIENSKFNSENWNGAWSTEYVDIVPAVTATSVDGDVVILISATENSLYCQSYTVEYTAGDPVFSVKFDKENWFKVAQGQASSVTAIPQYGIEPYTFLWESDTPELDGGTTDTLEIPATLDEGDYTVACLVTEDNGEGDAINALIGFTVEAIPVLSGDVYTLVKSADDFEEGAEYLIVSYSKDKFTSALKNEANGSRIGVEEVVIAEDDTVTTESDAIVWSIQASGTEGQYVLFNEAKGVYAAGPKSEGNNAQLLSDGSDALAQWILDFGELPAVAIGSVAYPERQLTRNSTATYEYFATYKGSGTKPYLFKKAGEAGLTVTLDKANGFTVDLGTADSITATAKNGTEPYEYVWSSDTAELNGTGEVLDIPATLAAGDYTVQVEVTDAEANKASKQIGFSVVAPAVKYPITIADGIENGEITVDKTEAEEGETVTVTATPADGFALEAITVNGIAISATTFPMPAEAVEVGATFAEVKDYAELPFIAEDTPYTGPWQKATIDGLTSKGLGTDYTSGGVSVGAKFDTTGDWMQIKFDGTPDELVYAIKGNSVSESNNSIFLVQESATGAEDAWSTLATYQTEDGTLTTSQETKTNALAADSRFVRFIYDTKGAGNVGIYGVYISSGGPAVFSITLDPSEDFEVEQNAEAFVTAIPKHAAEGVVGYAWWIDGTPVDTDGEVLALATAELGPHKVVCDATDASGAEADAHVIYTVVAPAVKYAVNVALGIQNGSVATDVSEAAEGDTVTVTATPVDGYRLVEIIVNNGDVAVSGNTFVMPAQDVLVTATFEEKPVVAGFTKITSLSELEEGEYVITGAKAEGEEYAMMASISTGSTKFLERRETAVELEDDVVTDAEESIIWTLAKDGDNWTIYNEAVGFAGYVASGNSAGAEAEASDKSKWTIAESETEGLFLLTNVGNTGRYLLYNASSPRFACYEKTTSGKALAFYKGSSGPVAFSIALNPAEDFEVQQGKDAAITATVRGAQGDVSYSWSVNGTPIDLTGNVYAIDSAEIGGPYEVVCEASDGVSEPVSASVSYTVVEAPPVTGDEFTLISSVDDLEDGAEYVITDNSQAYAMKAELSTGSTKRLLNEPVTPDGGVITTEDASIIWKLEEDEDGNFAFYNDSIEQYIGWSSGNSAKFQGDAFANTISYEDDLFVVLATSTAELEKPRKLQFNAAANSLQFAYYEGTQKNLCFFKKSGAAAPKVVYSGETTITAPGTFDLGFELKNYEGTCTWSLDPAEGCGAIDADGRYTWEVAEATRATITVSALDETGAEIAKAEVALTANEPGPQPGEPAIQYDGPETGVVGEELTCTVWAINMQNPTVEFEGNYGKPDDSSLGEGDIHFDGSVCTFTPDVAGVYWIEFCAYEGDSEAGICDKWTVTVSGPGPGPQPTVFQITGLTKTGDNLVLTFEGEGTPAVLGTASLASPQEWTPVEGAVVDGTSATVPMGAQRYIKLQ